MFCTQSIARRGVLGITRRGVLAGAALLALAAVLPACKSRGSAKGLEAIRERGELRIAMSGAYPPFNYFDDANRLVGFDVDVANEIARRLELPPRLITLRWDGILAGLTAGRYDLIIGSMAITPERAKAIDFSDPYYESGAQVFARPGSELAADGRLNGRKIGVNLGTTYEAEIRKRGEVGEIRTYGGIPELIVDLKAGRIDGFVTDRLVGFHAQSKARGGEPEFVAAGEPLYRERMGIAMVKEQPALRAAVDAALDGMRADGTWGAISTRWFGRDLSEGAPGGSDTATSSGDVEATGGGGGS